jgi:hypothetical protein
LEPPCKENGSLCNPRNETFKTHNLVVDHICDPDGCHILIGVRLDVKTKYDCRGLAMGAYTDIGHIRDLMSAYEEETMILYDQIPEEVRRSICLFGSVHMLYDERDKLTLSERTPQRLVEAVEKNIRLREFLAVTSAVVTSEMTINIQGDIIHPLWGREISQIIQAIPEINFIIN